MEATLKFQDLSADVHHCTSHRKGDWITWRCPLCEGYERRFNWRTGEMEVIGRTLAQHTGFSDKPQNMEALRQNQNSN